MSGDLFAGLLVGSGGFSIEVIVSDDESVESDPASVVVYANEAPLSSRSAGMSWLLTQVQGDQPCIVHADVECTGDS